MEQKLRRKNKPRARLVGRALILKRQRSQHIGQAGGDTPLAITTIQASNVLLRSSCYVVRKNALAFHGKSDFFLPIIMVFPRLLRATDGYPTDFSHLRSICKLFLRFSFSRTSVGISRRPASDPDARDSF